MRAGARRRRKLELVALEAGAELFAVDVSGCGFSDVFDCAAGGGGAVGVGVDC